MTITPIANSPGDTFAVTPVVEYEPPPRNIPPCGQSSHAARRPHTPQLARRQPIRPSGRAPAAVTSTAKSPRLRQAGTFADAALRRVLEVIDRRRPVGQLRPLLAPGLVDSVLAVSRTAAGHQQGAAMLRRIRLTPAGPDTADTAAEVFGTYSRGDRIHAIACRVEQRPAGNETRWLMVALHIG